MLLTHLRLRCFRNITELDLATQSPWILLEGNNGQGKTNILEAIGLCTTGRSFRTNHLSQLQQHGSVASRCEATFVRQGVSRQVAVTLKGKERLIWLDERQLRQRANLLHHVNVVLFLPEHLQLIQGGPEQRRRFLDRACAGGRPSFVAATFGYHRVLKARNALLRQTHLSSRDSQLAIYDQQLSDFGAVLHHERQCFVDFLQQVAGKAYDQLSLQKEQPYFQLKSGLPQGNFSAAMTVANYREVFAACLCRYLHQDKLRGTTQFGPHRGDLQIALGLGPARHFASQGEQRSLVLALKCAEIEYLRVQMQSSPLLLLDDVASELDPQRLQRLLLLLTDKVDQVWLTASADLFSQFVSGVACQCFEVKAGTIALKN